MVLGSSSTSPRAAGNAPQLVSHGPHGLDDALGELAPAEVAFHRRGHGGPEIRARLLVDRDVAEDAELMGARRDVDETPLCSAVFVIPSR